MDNICYQNPADDSWTNVVAEGDDYVETDTKHLTEKLANILGVEFEGTCPDIGPIAYPAD